MWSATPVRTVMTINGCLFQGKAGSPGERGLSGISVSINLHFLLCSMALSGTQWNAHSEGSKSMDYVRRTLNNHTYAGINDLKPCWQRTVSFKLLTGNLYCSLGNLSNTSLAVDQIRVYVIFSVAHCR